MLLDLSLAQSYQDSALLLVRVILGIVMIYYGWPKIKDLRSNAEDFKKKGFVPGIMWGSIVAFVEFFGGMLMILGMYVWVAALLFGFEMLMGTFWKIFKTDKSFADYSYDLLLLAMMIMILITGAGNYSLAALL